MRFNNDKMTNINDTKLLLMLPMILQKYHSKINLKYPINVQVNLPNSPLSFKRMNKTQMKINKTIIEDFSDDDEHDCECE